MPIVTELVQGVAHLPKCLARLLLVDPLRVVGGRAGDGGHERHRRAGAQPVHRDAHDVDESFAVADGRPLERQGVVQRVADGCVGRLDDDQRLVRAVESAQHAHVAARERPAQGRARTLAFELLGGVGNVGARLLGRRAVLGRDGGARRCSVAQRAGPFEQFGIEPELGPWRRDQGLGQEGATEPDEGGHAEAGDECPARVGRWRRWLDAGERREEQVGPDRHDRRQPGHQRRDDPQRSEVPGRGAARLGRRFDGLGARALGATTAGAATRRGPPGPDREPRALDRGQAVLGPGLWPGRGEGMNRPPSGCARATDGSTRVTRNRLEAHSTRPCKAARRGAHPSERC